MIILYYIFIGIVCIQLFYIFVKNVNARDKLKKVIARGKLKQFQFDQYISTGMQTRKDSLELSIIINAGELFLQPSQMLFFVSDFTIDDFDLHEKSYKTAKLKFYTIPDERKIEEKINRLGFFIKH